MRLGINLLCLSGYIDHEHLPLLEGLPALGFDGVEIPVLRGDPEHYRRLGRALDDMGLRRTCTGIVPSPDGDPLSADPEVKARGVAHLDWALDCAIALGAESLGGPMHAPIGHFTGTGPTADQIERGVPVHRALAERAAAHGIILSIEALNRFETYFLNTMAQCRAYAEQVDHPAFRIMYDTFHANIEEQDPLAAVDTIAEHLGVFHVAENDRGIPGRGHIDFPGTFRRLRAKGFDGWLVIEAFSTGLPEIAAATRVWRPLYPDFDTLAAEGSRYVRETWEAAA